MSIGRELSRLVLGTVVSAIDLISGAGWITIGGLLLIGVAGVVFAPVWNHLAQYWWLYLLLVTVVPVLLVLVFANLGRGTSKLAPPSVGMAESTEQHTAEGRPTSGRALFRFTDEWLTREGLFAGRSIPKAEAARIAGRSAIAYHLREGNFMERNGEIVLTSKGHAHFTERRSRL